MNSGSPHEEFLGAGAAPGVEIWRIEKFLPVKHDDISGTFYSGDSYIVLKTSASESGKLLWHIHFWLGSETTRDEMGAAALKTIELDDSFGGAAVQHREVMGHESGVFLSYFPDGLKYLEGGIASGFTKPKEDEYETRLLQVKGKRRPRVFQVALSTNSLNDGDAFILDAGMVLHVWAGEWCNRGERGAAIETARKISRDERRNKAEVVVMDQTEESEAFWSLLGGPAPIASAAKGGDDEEASRSVDAQTKLFRLCDEGGALQTTEVEAKPLARALLDPKDVFVLDCSSELYVWIGEGCTKEERTAGMDLALKFLEEGGRPSHTPMAKVKMGREPPLFKAKFVDWEILREERPVRQAPTQAAVDVKAVGASLHGARQSYADSGTLRAEKATSAIDPGSQVLEVAAGLSLTLILTVSFPLEVYRIESFKTVAVPDGLEGHFFQGDSYVVRYKFESKRRQNEVIYFWQGQTSSSDEKAASALEAQRMFQEGGAKAVQVRVVMNKEPEHFYAAFATLGGVVVHSGGRGSGWKNRKEEDSYDTDGVSLFHVRGDTEANVHAVQVAEKVASLNSGDAFVLTSPDTVHVWFGKGCEAFERGEALRVAARLNKDSKYLPQKDGKEEDLSSRPVVEVEEGAEPDGFWALLGGPGEYASAKWLAEGSRAPRLYQLTYLGGKFRVEEIVDFAQEDLADDDVMLLDCYNEVFIWVGTAANKQEREGCGAIAQSFVDSATDGRDPACPIQTVSAGAEPPMFTAHFIGWLHAEDVPEEQRKHSAATEATLQEVAAAPLGDGKWESRRDEKARLQAEAQRAKAAADAVEKERLLAAGKAHFEGQEATKQAALEAERKKLEDQALAFANKTEAQKKEWREQKSAAKAAKEAAKQKALEDAMDEDQKRRHRLTQELCEATGLDAAIVNMPYMKLKKLAKENGVPADALKNCLDKNEVLHAMAPYMKDSGPAAAPAVEEAKKPDLPSQIYWSVYGPSFVVPHKERMEMILDQKGITYESVDLAECENKRERRADMEARSESKELPQLFIRGQFIGAGVEAIEELMYMNDMGDL